MNGQQIITWLVVLTAAIYLGRNLVRSARAFFSAKGGCGSGCGKCAFAQQVQQAQKSPKSGVIPLAEVRSAPHKS